jgi:hypothetical protein
VGFIRPFVKEDIPLVVELYGRVFQESKSPNLQKLMSYFNDIYFSNPWYDDKLPSLVHQESHETITGFVGVMPRRMSLRDQPIHAAIGAQLMVEPGSRTSMAGLQLVETFFSGAQDLSLIDGATDAYRKIHEALGGTVALLYSFYWSRSLPSVQTAPPGETEELTEEMLCSCLSAYASGYVLRPEYDVRSLRWLLRLAEQLTQHGTLQKRVLRDTDRRVLGWYLYYRNPGGVGEVLQVAAEKGATGDVLDSLFYDAWQHGVTSLRGRIEPRLRQALAGKDCRFHRGHWLLVHTKSPELLQVIQRGEALFTRLDGEWCLRAP